MHFPRVAVIAILSVATAAAGCCCPSGCCLPATSELPCDLPLTVAQAGPPELMRVVPDCQAEGCDLQPLPTPSDVYHLLTPEDAQCRAAANANVANMVELEQHWAQVIIECDSKYVRRNMCLLHDLLELRAVHARNLAAGSALEAFYQLAGLEARRHYLEMAIDEVSASLSRADELDESDLLPDEIERDQLRAELSTLEDQSLQLEFLRLQLNGQLQKLIGCPVSESTFFWPQVDWAPDMTPIDADVALAMGLSERHDLRAIGLIWCNLEQSTLRVARAVLQVADGSVGSVEPTNGILHRIRCLRCRDHEVDVRCRQLEMFYNDTEQLVTAEIKEAAFRIVLQQQRIAAARQAVEDRRANLYELSAMRDVDDVAVFQLSEARTRLYDAESDLIEQVAALQAAEAQLKRAQGMLAGECGFVPQLCRENCCQGACTRCRAPTCPPCAIPDVCEKCCQD